MITKLITLLLFCTFVILTACDTTQKPANIPVQTTNSIKNVAWMREKLPAGTLAYMRIPTLWELFFEAKGDALGQVQMLDEHKAQINQFKQGIVDNYSDLLPQEALLAFRLLIKKMTTPLEIAAINAADGSMFPNMLFATTLKDTDLKYLNTIIEQLVPEIKIISPFSSKGQAHLMIAMVPVFISFDQKTGRLALFSGLTSSEIGLHGLLAQKQHAEELNNIFEFENSVDQSGKNLEFWLNIKSIYQQNKAYIPPDSKPIIKNMGLDKIEYLWVGTASTNGKSEIIFQLGMPEVGFRQFLPRVDTEFNVQTAGSPRSVWQIAIPNVEQIEQGFELAISLSPNPDELRQQFIKIIEKANDFLGVTLTEIMNIYGQKLLVVTDDSGTWFANRILNRQAHTQMMQKLSQPFNIKTTSKKLAGVEITQSITSINAFVKKVFQDNNDIQLNPMAEMFNFKQYSYYQIEGDYILQAITPQVLADRANSRSKVNLQDWLGSQQKLNWDHSIFAYSKEVEDAPRDIYYTYLRTLLFLGNLANVDVDLFSLPTAQQLKLPQKGRFGFSLDSSDSALAMKISYEYSIFEGMSSTNSFVAVAFVGMLAAYAIPAYNDYTIRAQISQKIFSIFDKKRLIEEHYSQHKNFISTGSLSTRFDASEEFLYNSKNGEITIYFTENSASGLRGKNIKITPTIDANGLLQWHCSGTVAARHYQSICSRL